MKRFELWLTMVIVFSLPPMVFAQATGGCSGKSKVNGATKTTEGKKGTAHPQLAIKGTSTPTKTTGNGNAPVLESQPGSPTGGAGKTIEHGTDRKGIKGPITSAKKKPPRPAQAKPPDQE